MATATKGKSKSAANGKEPGAREKARQAKQEAEAKARQAKIDNGDLIVVGKSEFEAASKDTQSSAQIKKILDAYKASDKPLVFADVAKKAGAKYPEDLIPCMYSLELIGLVRRFGARTANERRARQAFLWVG